MTFDFKKYHPELQGEESEKERRISELEKSTVNFYDLKVQFHEFQKFVLSVLPTKQVANETSKQGSLFEVSSDDE